MTTYQTEEPEDYRFVSFTLDRKPLALERAIDPTRLSHTMRAAGTAAARDPFDSGDGIENVSNIPDAAMLSLVFQAVWIQRWHF